MPRRIRAQVHPLRKRTPPAAPSARRRVAEPAEIDAADPALDAGVETAASPASVPYIRRRPAIEAGRGSATAAPISQAMPGRIARPLVTDYGYIISELRRIGLTFGGLLLLLIVVARLLR